MSHKRKRVLISAGGTGGHLFPAQALAEELNTHPSIEGLMFAGEGLKTSRYFDRSRFCFQEISASSLVWSRPLKFFRGMKSLIQGICQSVSLIKNFRPDVIVGFGSFHSVPVILAASFLRIPIILYEANSVPGKANQWLAPLATCVALHIPSAAPYFKGKTIQVSPPLREGFSFKEVDRESSLNYFGLYPNRKTLLICGGSQGARKINQLVEKCLSNFKNLFLQVIHLTGDPLGIEGLKSLYLQHDIPAYVKSFEKNMQMAWRASDAFLGRGGASTLAESIEFEVPGIVIPYPYANHHQDKNADYLVETVGCAVKLLEKETTPKLLGETIENLLNHPFYSQYKEAIKKVKNQQGLKTLSQLILQF